MKRLLATTLGRGCARRPGGTAAADSIVYVKDQQRLDRQPRRLGRPRGHDGRRVRLALPVARRRPTTAPSRPAGAQEIVKLDQQGTVLAQWDPHRPPYSASFAGEPPPGRRGHARTARRSPTRSTATAASRAPRAARRHVTVYLSADRKQELRLRVQPHGARVDLEQRDPRLRRLRQERRCSTRRTPATTTPSPLVRRPGRDRDIADGELSRARATAWRCCATTATTSTCRSTRSTACTSRAGGGVQRPARSRTLNDPTWSPDGKRLAFALKEGIEVLPLPNVVAGDCPGAQSGKVVLPGRQRARLGPARTSSRATRSRPTSRRGRRCRRRWTRA